MDLSSPLSFISFLGTQSIFRWSRDRYQSRWGYSTSNLCTLPYALVPGMDLSSTAYQKATALLSKVANEATTQLPASTGVRLIPSDFGK